MIHKQYDQTKKLYPGHIVLMRIGDFMEAFDDDARTVSQICATIMTKVKGRWCTGFPYFATEHHVGELVKAGHKVALAEPVKERS